MGCYLVSSTYLIKVPNSVKKFCKTIKNDHHKVYPVDSLIVDSQKCITNFFTKLEMENLF